MLPQIGTANPQIYGRKKHLAETLNNSSLEGSATRNGADFPNKALAKYSHSKDVQSIGSGYNNTGFNWKQVEMKNSGAFEDSIITERGE